MKEKFWLKYFSLEWIIIEIFFQISKANFLKLYLKFKAQGLSSFTNISKELQLIVKILVLCYIRQCLVLWQCILLLIFLQRFDTKIENAIVLLLFQTHVYGIQSQKFKRNTFTNNIYVVVEKSCYIAQKTWNKYPPLATPMAQSKLSTEHAAVHFCASYPGWLLLLPWSDRLF